MEYEHTAKKRKTSKTIFVSLNLPFSIVSASPIYRVIHLLVIKCTLHINQATIEVTKKF